MPIAAKLKRASELEVGFRYMIVEGILSIQAGTNPRALSDKLSTYLAPSERAALEDKKSA
jgi:chemotaxis protein MotA